METDSSLTVMTREQALRKRSQYQTVYKSGRAWVDGFVVVKALPNGLEMSRFGFSVTKALGNAVVRNRVRRLLKEIVRLTPIEQGWDIVFIARPGAAVAGYYRLNMSVNKLLAQAHLLRGKNEVASAELN